MNRFYSSLTCFVAAHGLAACAGLPPVDWEHGAKRGEIVEVINGDAPAAALLPCLAALPASERAGRQFVKVHRFARRYMAVEIADVAAGVPMVPGTPVEVYPGDCAGGKLSHVTRVLSAQ
ncbi:MAG: hypothetical protein NVSMB6_19500 [Burkholderiaceae bacterium]